MDQRHDGGQGTAGTDARDTGSRFAPPINTQDVFRRMILDEIRQGRLTRARRRRIVQYAANLGLSAVEAGRMIAACRDELLEGEDHSARVQALRVVEPPRESPTFARWAINIAGTILLAWLLWQVWAE